MRVDNNYVQMGYSFTKGAVIYALSTAIGIFLCTVLVWFVMNLFAFGVDSTDRSAWDRSGLKLYKDHGTGVEYLSDGKGGLIERGKKDYN